MRTHGGGCEEDIVRYRLIPLLEDQGRNHAMQDEEQGTFRGRGKRKKQETRWDRWNDPTTETSE